MKVKFCLFCLVAQFPFELIYTPLYGHHVDIYYTLNVLCNPFCAVDYSTVSHWAAGSDKEQVVYVI